MSYPSCGLISPRLARLVALMAVALVFTLVAADVVSDPALASSRWSIQSTPNP